MSKQTISNLGFMQIPVVAGDIQNNFEQVKIALAKLAPEPGSLIALPEMWATGFVYEQLDTLSDEIPDLLRELEVLAQSYKVVLAGSLPVKDNGLLLNKLVFSGLEDEGDQTQGIIKQQLFSFWKEDHWFHAGNRPTPVSFSDEEQVGGLVCYDIRFPETARLQCCQGAEILLVSAEWPLARVEHWRILLQARAIENQAFVVAANMCGEWSGMQMGGHSLIIAPDGKILVEAGEEQESVSVALDKSIQKEVRQRFNTVAPSPWAVEDGEKVVSLEHLVKIVSNRKRIGQKVVFTNGCFDILHAGHVDYLQKARRQGDFLILGLNDDQSIRSIKGEKRPVNKEDDRARVLAALGCVDAIVLFGEDTPLALITALCPDVLVKGADWEEDEIVGAKEVKAEGGRVERIPFVNKMSTTDIIESIVSVGGG